MGKTIRLALVLPILALLALPASAITFGEPDGGDHPAVVAIILDFTDIGHPVFQGYGESCTGTLIHPRVVLTAAHCTLDLAALGYPSSELDLWISTHEDPVRHLWGTHEPDRENWIEVAAIVTHPDFTWVPSGSFFLHVSDPHDIAALILAEEVADIEPARLPPEGFLDALEPDLKHGSFRAQFLAVGYGGQITFPPPEVVYYDTRWRAWMSYQTLLQAWLVTSQNPRRGDGGTCYGDSGGPVFLVDEEGNETLVAITSWGDPCVAMGRYYRTDIPGATAFIADVLDRLERGTSAP